MITLLLRKILKPFFEGFSLWRKSKNHACLMELLRVRIIFSCVCGVFIFGCVAYRLADIMIVGKYTAADLKNFEKEKIIKKADIVDRTGELLATSIITASCYADPSVVIDIDETSKALSKIHAMPKKERIKNKLLDKNKHFVWISRHVTPQIQEKIMDLGLPGIQFQKDFKRIYIHGNLFSHIIGYTDIDGNGISAIEKKFNKELVVKDFTNKKLVLSLDLRLQSIVHEELSATISKFKAIGGNAILMSVDGEILSMVSFPDFDPNNIKNSSNNEAMFNRNTLGAFEQGSILKILNVAIALDSGSSRINSMFDASCPIKLGRHSIKDFKGKGRRLSLAEAFVFSSNIASVKIAQSFGVKVQKEYMKNFGMLDKVNLEIPDPEIGSPIAPQNWTEATCMTVSYGYGLAITPLQLLTAVTSIVNNGNKVSPTLLYGTKNNNEEKIKLISNETSETVRDLMRAVICFGTGKKAGVEGVDIFGKTGTAYKMCGRGYGTDGNRARITTFLGGFPKDKPKYMLMIMLDNPKAVDGTFGYATAGWNVAPTAHNIFKRIIPILHDGSNQNQSELKVAKYIKLD